MKEYPVFTVRGSNWEANVPTDAYNQQFSLTTQMIECATKAIEAFKGMNNGVAMLMDDGQETPMVGPTLLVYPYNAKREKPFVVFAHVLFANGGFYADSVEVDFVLKKSQHSVLDEARAHGGSVMSLAMSLEEQLENFDNLRTEVKKKKRKKK